MPNPTVTVITANARSAEAQDAFSNQDYIEMFQEIRVFDETTGKYAMSLDDFGHLCPAYSKAQWSKWQNGQIALNRIMKNELRNAVGIPLLPLTIEQALADVDPDAEVVEIGGGETFRVIKLRTAQALNLFVNGSITATSQDTPPVARVPMVTRKKDNCRRRYRPELPEACRELVDELRDRNLDFAQVLRAGLNTYTVLEDL